MSPVLVRYIKCRRYYFCERGKAIKPKYLCLLSLQCCYYYSLLKQGRIMMLVEIIANYIFYQNLDDAVYLKQHLIHVMSQLLPATGKVHKYKQQRK